MEFEVLSEFSSGHILVSFVGIGPFHLDSVQCDQMAFIVFIICPFTGLKNCPKSVTIFAKY